MITIPNALRGLAAALIAATTACAVEKPDYKVVEKHEKLELRQYDDLPIASAPMGGFDSRDGSFMKLFRYIDRGNAAEQKIAMTAPVIMESGPTREGAPATGRMSFVLPAEVAAQGAPSPSAEDVTVGTLPGGRIAVIRFEGHQSESSRNTAIATLQAWVSERGWKAAGDPFLAFYDPPWTPEKMRRNEVWLRLAE